MPMDERFRYYARETWHQMRKASEKRGTVPLVVITGNLLSDDDEMHLHAIVGASVSDEEVVMVLEAALEMIKARQRTERIEVRPPDAQSN